MSLAHPHDLMDPVPELLTAEELRGYSQLSHARAVGAIAIEWATIVAAIWIAIAAAWWPVTVLAVFVIGARQHALTVISHDATHFRLLRRRSWNDWVANIFLAWPMFISVQGFRYFHGDHHRYLGKEKDGNRALWNTHGPDGRLRPEWRYPKSRWQLVIKLLRRTAVVTGVFWMLRGLVGGFMFGVSPAGHVVRVSLFAALFAALTHFGAWTGFLIYWVLPYCTWHAAAQYIRLVCEHSAVRSADPRYAVTRSTIPGLLARFFVLPRNIGYHLEHHWYPSVPYYNLPQLHARLAAQPEFSAHARFTSSIFASLGECTRTQEAQLRTQNRGVSRT